MWNSPFKSSDKLCLFISWFDWTPLSLLQENADDMQLPSLMNLITVSNNKETQQLLTAALSSRSSTSQRTNTGQGTKQRAAEEPSRIGPERGFQPSNWKATKDQWKFRFLLGMMLGKSALICFIKCAELQERTRTRVRKRKLMGLISLKSHQNPRVTWQ